MHKDVQYHRRFLPDGAFEQLCNRGCHGNPQPSSNLAKAASELWGASSPSNSAGASMSLAGPFAQAGGGGNSAPRQKPYFRSQRRRRAYMHSAEGLRPIHIVDKIDQDFAAHATAWEREWSNLVSAGPRRFEPVVDGDWTVIGHLGMIAGTGLILPQGVLHAPNLLEPTLDEDVPVFVSWTVPAGWEMYCTLKPDLYFTVVTGIDGQVLTGKYAGSAAGAISVDGPVDAIMTGVGFAKLGTALLRGLVKSLARRVSQSAGTSLFFGPTKDVLKRALGKRAGKSLRGAFEPRTGMPKGHFRAFQAAAQETDLIVIVRNTNTASVKLIERGCPGKPKSLEFVNTSPRTGIVMAGGPADLPALHKAGFFVVGEDRIARRVVLKGGKEVTEELPLKDPFWEVEKGQVIDPVSKKPVVGDYDLMGVVDPRNPGQNIALIASHGQKLVNITNPHLERFAAVVNRKLDMPRVLHGAQDQYKGFRKGATAFHPDGRVTYLETEAEVKQFYEEVLRRQTIVGRYPGPPEGVEVVDELAARRAKKQVVP